MTKTFEDAAVQPVRDVIEKLIDLRPDPGTDESELLVGLATAVDRWERAKYPHLTSKPVVREPNSSG